MSRQLFRSDLGGARPAGGRGPPAVRRAGELPRRGSAEDAGGGRLRVLPSGIPPLHKDREPRGPDEARHVPAAAGAAGSQSGRLGCNNGSRLGLSGSLLERGA